MTRQELIERLEKAEGADRELDAEIVVAIDFRPGWLIEQPGELWLDGPDVRYRHPSQHRNPGNPSAWARDFPQFTSSVDAAIRMAEHCLPGWSWRVATCCVSDDAWVLPDFNCPIHGERLRQQFDEATDWVDITDVDLRPSGRPAIALCISVLTALEATEATTV